MDGKGVHGEFHKIKVDEEREFWKIVSALPVADGGDHLLAAAIDRVYTRYDANFYHGPMWHWPYLNSRRTVQVANKLLKEYPRSALTELTLWLEAFALRCPPLEQVPDFDNSREQKEWKPDAEAARTIYREITERFPKGRYAAASRAVADVAVLTIDLPASPMEPDPRSSDPAPTNLRPRR
jgi:hypothetical protein